MINHSKPALSWYWGTDPAAGSNRGLLHLSFPSLHETIRLRRRLIWVVDVSGSMNDTIGSNPSMSNIQAQGQKFVGQPPQWPVLTGGQFPCAFVNGGLDVKNRTTSKLDLVKQALIRYVHHLHDEDEVVLITFNETARCVFNGIGRPLQKDLLVHHIQGLQAMGGTSIQSGLEMALSLAPCGNEKVSRVLLLSDGQATQGWSHLTHFSASTQTFLKHGVSLSCMGVGDFYNEFLLSELALNHHGLFAHLQEKEDFKGWIDRENESLNHVWAKRFWASLSFSRLDGSGTVSRPLKPIEGSRGWTMPSPQQWTYECLNINDQERHWVLDMELPTFWQGANVQCCLEWQWMDVDQQVHYEKEIIFQGILKSPHDESTSLTSLVQSHWDLWKAQKQLQKSQEYAQKGSREEAARFLNQAWASMDSSGLACAGALKDQTQLYASSIQDLGCSPQRLSKMATQSAYLAAQSHRMPLDSTLSSGDDAESINKNKDINQKDIQS